MKLALFHEGYIWIWSHQTIVGCAIVGFFTVVLSLSGILKTKGDKESKRSTKRTRYYVAYGICLVVGMLGIFLGTLLTKQAADVAANRAARLQGEMSDKIARMEL